MSVPVRVFRFPDTAGQWREVAIRDYVGAHYRETVDVVRGVLVAAGLAFSELETRDGAGSRVVLTSAGREGVAS